eukprot:4644667-Alexandrium_andersonii.AAC.1
MQAHVHTGALARAHAHTHRRMLTQARRHAHARAHTHALLLRTGELRQPPEGDPTHEGRTQPAKEA